MFRFLAVAAVVCAALIPSVVNMGTAHATSMPTFGQVISVINHTDTAVTALSSVSTVPVTALTIVPVSYPAQPTDHNRVAIDNALARNASSIAALQQLLGTLSVVGDGVCDESFCPSVSDYLSNQGIPLTSVIGAIPGNPVAPISALNPLVIYVIPSDPI